MFIFPEIEHSAMFYFHVRKRANFRETKATRSSRLGAFYATHLSCLIHLMCLRVLFREGLRVLFREGAGISHRSEPAQRRFCVSHILTTPSSPHVAKRPPAGWALRERAEPEACPHVVTLMFAN